MQVHGAVQYATLQGLVPPVNGCVKLLLLFRKVQLGENVFDNNTNNVLSDTELRWFWISWLHGVIKYGRGSQVGQELLGFYIDPSPTPVNYMSVSAYDNIRVYWVIPSDLYLTPGMWC